ncbi:helix-turn-helix transcriptional regulator [Brassicibacter mesophilus]|uniref:helix-turn-helix transcriptional regulator n=1 Tax=Brassicibacter mesophilus TaxID=745119 RepID=UPI003D2534B7
MALKTRIREFRAKYNLSQEELAKMVGVRRETIGNLENGKYNPSLKLAMDISKVFETTIEEVFTYED